MSEIYPADNDLLNLLNDTETGVEYIPTGTAPYYLHFRKLLYRLLLAAKRSNDLRVYDEGDLEIGVKAGKFWIGTTLVNYTGSSGNLLEDDKEEIYVYLDYLGDLVVNEYSGFPDMASERHVRLAIVSTSQGQVVSITDARDHHSISMPGAAAGGDVIESHTTDDTLTEMESGSVHTNLGATGAVTLTLPASATAGTRFSFAVQAAQQLCIDPGTATIRDDCGQTADKYKWANYIGECLAVIADENGDWAVIAKRGSWYEEA